MSDSSSEASDNDDIALPSDTLAMLRGLMVGEGMVDEATSSLVSLDEIAATFRSRTNDDDGDDNAESDDDDDDDDDNGGSNIDGNANTGSFNYTEYYKNLHSDAADAPAAAAIEAPESFLENPVVLITVEEKYVRDCLIKVRLAPI